MKPLTDDEAYAMLAAYSARAEHCRADATLKLLQWGIGREAADRIVRQLADEGYLDDERYCRAFVRDKFRLDHWGKQKIVQALMAKHIPAATYQPCLDAIDQDDYLATLRTLLAAKQRSVRADTDYDRRTKLIRFALGRGFEMEAILHCLAEADDGD